MSDFEQALAVRKVEARLNGYWVSDEDFKLGWQAAKQSMQGEDKPVGNDLVERLKHSNTCYDWINRQNQEAAAEIARLQKELEEARKDADRYRWLLNNCLAEDQDGFLSLHFETDRPAKMRPEGLRHFWINEDIGTAIKNHNHKKETL